MQANSKGACWIWLLALCSACAAAGGGGGGVGTVGGPAGSACNSQVQQEGCNAGSRMACTVGAWSLIETCGAGLMCAETVLGDNTGKRTTACQPAPVSTADVFISGDVGGLSDLPLPPKDAAQPSDALADVAPQNDAPVGTDTDYLPPDTGKDIAKDVANTVCGNNKCEAGETSKTCPMDCPVQPYCGDGSCDFPENTVNCQQDCAASACGDGQCVSPETASSCPADCKPGVLCGNGTCDSSESQASCPADCSSCGDGSCSGNESASQCAMDCDSSLVDVMACTQSACGAAWKNCVGVITCAGTASCLFQCTDTSCIQGCIDSGFGSSKTNAQTLYACSGAQLCLCGDGLCGSMETSSNCPVDCQPPVKCGDGKCQAPETALSCAADCGCGNGKCEGSETVANCPKDCKPVCGNGKCEGTETQANCSADCGVAPSCGDGTCGSGETVASCPADCKTTGHFCDANCGGDASDGAGAIVCYCDTTCKTSGDCCNAAGTATAGYACTGSTCADCK